MNPPRLDENGPGSWRLSGDLDLAGVGALANEAARIARTTSPSSIDLSGIGRMDSAALALLLECKRLANASGNPLQLRGAPRQLQSIAALYGIEGLLEFRNDE